MSSGSIFTGARILLGLALLQVLFRLFSTAIEAAWMEIAMIAATAFLYALFASGLQFPAIGMKSPKEKKHVEVPADMSSNDHRELLLKWHKAIAINQASSLDLTSVVDAMLKLGRSHDDVATELRAALQEDTKMLERVALLLQALLRDDSVELLSVVLRVLEEKVHPIDVAVYAGLMQAYLRRRDYARVTATGLRFNLQDATPRMLAMLATAAAHQSQLAEALSYVKLLPDVPPGGKTLLSPAAVSQIIGLAVKEKQVMTVAEEIFRVRGTMEPKHLDDLVAIESRRRGPASCKELFEAAALLHVAKGPGAYQALALALATAADPEGIENLLLELEADKENLVTEALALALLEACKAVSDGDLAFRSVELHRAACAGSMGGKVLTAAFTVLLSCDRAMDACNFYEREMQSKGIALEPVLAQQLIKAAQQCGRQSLVSRLTDHSTEQRGKHEPRTNRRSGETTGETGDLQRYAGIIKAYAKERDLKGATAVYQRLQASGVTLSPMLCNCFLDACVQCGDFEGTLKHFEEMKQSGLADIVGYNTVLKIFLQRGRSEEARKLVQEMNSRGLQANKVTYNELLHAKVIAKDNKGIWAVVDEMHEAGVKANSVTCSILLKSLTVHSSSSDVTRVVDLIEEVEDPIDEVLFSSVIEACIRIKQLDLLSDLMRRYRSKKGFINLTAPTYGSMIKAYGHAGDIQRVKELWAEMEENRVKPTSITLGCMVEALVVAHQAEEAWNLVHRQLEIEDRKGCINTVIYSTVLKGFAVARRIDKVFAVYSEMRSRGVPCNTITYNTMLDACAKCCAMDRASSLLMDMKEGCVEPDIITYSTIVKGYCLEGDVDRAFHVLEEMKSDDKFAPDEIMYNSILDGCAKQHRVDEALKVLQEMKSAGVAPSNYTLSILVKLLGHARKLNQAFRMVEDLSSKNGFRPNIQVYTCLVQACVLNRRLDRALELYNQMIGDSGCAADEKFYAVLVRGCLQLHQPLKAVEVVRAAFQLPGHGLAQPSRPNAPVVGVETRAVEEVVGKLQASGAEEQAALADLEADLLKYRKLQLPEGKQGKEGRSKARRGSGSGKGA